MTTHQSLPFLKLLAHNLRWNLLTLLAKSDYRVQELVNLVDEPQNLVSYHLHQLRKAHLVTERRSSADARDIYYSLDMTRLQNLYVEAGTNLHPALGHQTPISLDHPHRILFLCTENSARSQLAEGILRGAAANVEVFSAGSMPTQVHPYAIQAAAELGIDLTAHRSRHLDEFAGESFDYVITVCDLAREICPTFPGGAAYIHWSLPDPAITNDYAAFQETALEIDKRVRFLLPQLGGDNHG